LKYKLNNWIDIIYGAGGHSKVIAEILESMGKTIYGIFDDNQCVEEIRGTKVEKGYGFRAKIPFSFRVSCNN
jgi:16S rRNA C1402 N4-methylase RsmH